MTTLLDLFAHTGKRKYLEPLPRALDYYRRSLLPDGRLARFYELGTNKPLYFTREYQLTYSDADLPTHYGFKVNSQLDRIEKRYQALVSTPWRAPAAPPPVKRPTAESVRAIVDAMDERGAWVEDGRLRYWGQEDGTTRIIDPGTFARNVRTLARFVAKK